MTTPNMVMHQVLQVTILLQALFTELTVDGGVINNFVDTEEQFYKDEVNNVVRRWAPLVLLAPGEQFMPSSVPYFLQNMMPANQYNKHVMQQQDLPGGIASEYYHLFTKHPVEQLLLNSSSFLYGQNPQHESVPVYTVITRCDTNKYPSWFMNPLNHTPQKGTFHVTYWFFYPFNEGKNVCTLSLGFLGPVPIPKMFNKCLGEQQYVGNHVGDWEHMSLYFNDSDIPETMYVSTHDAGVYYRLDKETNVFKYERQETRNGILQAPKFPTKVYLLHGHPLLYSAKGSHGLWSKPGKHRYTTVPRFYDDTGNGTPWKTWDNLEIIDPPYNIVPKWMKYRGRWGNSKSYCHPLKKLGIDICQLSDGPTGIPMKRLNFKCPKKL